MLFKNISRITSCYMQNATCSKDNIFHKIKLNPYLVFDLKDHMLNPTFYTLISDCSFYFQGSIGKNKWDMIDAINECNLLRNHNEIEYRNIRLNQTCATWIINTPFY